MQPKQVQDFDSKKYQYFRDKDLAAELLFWKSERVYLEINFLTSMKNKLKKDIPPFHNSANYHWKLDNGLWL